MAAERPTVHAGRQASRNLDNHKHVHRIDDPAAGRFWSPVVTGGIGKATAISLAAAGAPGGFSVRPIIDI